LLESSWSRPYSATAAKREAVVHLRTVLEMSERRACTIVAADRKMIRYTHRARRRITEALIAIG
jgi:hypothetical protein